MRDDDERPVEARRARGSSCSTASRSRWFVGLVEDEHVHAAAPGAPRVRARVRSPGESDEHDATDVVGAEPELREQRPRSDRGRARSGHELVERGDASPAYALAPDRSTPMQRSRPTLRAAADERQRRQEHPAAASTCRCRCARAIDESLTQARGRRRSARGGTSPRSHDRSRRLEHLVRRAASRPRASGSAPVLERLLGQLVALEEALCLAHLRLECVRRAPIRRRRSCLPSERAFRARLRSPVLGAPVSCHGAAAPARTRLARRRARRRVRVWRSRSSRRPTRAARRERRIDRSRSRFRVEESSRSWRDERRSAPR